MTVNETPQLVGWICERCRHWMYDTPPQCPDCLHPVYIPVFEFGVSERRAEQLLTGQEP